MIPGSSAWSLFHQLSHQFCELCIFLSHLSLYKLAKVSSVSAFRKSDGTTQEQSQGLVEQIRIILLWNYRITIYIAINTLHSTFKAPRFCDVYRASLTFIGLLLRVVLADKKIKAPGKLDKTEIK